MQASKFSYSENNLSYFARKVVLNAERFTLYARGCFRTRDTLYLTHGISFSFVLVTPSTRVLNVMTLCRQRLVPTTFCLYSIKRAADKYYIRIFKIANIPPPTPFSVQVQPRLLQSRPTSSNSTRVILNAQDVVIRWLLPLLARAFGARVRGQRRRAVLVHPRLQGCPQAVTLAGDDGKDECHNSGIEPYIDDRVNKHDRCVGFVSIVEVEVGEDENREIDEHVQVGDKIHDSRDKEKCCGLQWPFSLIKGVHDGVACLTPMMFDKLQQAWSVTYILQYVVVLCLVEDHGRESQQ